MDSGRVYSDDDLEPVDPCSYDSGDDVEPLDRGYDDSDEEDRHDGDDGGHGEGGVIGRRQRGR